MDRIIIINDHQIEQKLDEFILANKRNIRFVSDMEQLSLKEDPMLREIFDQYKEKHKIRIKSGHQLWIFKCSEIIRMEEKGKSIRFHLTDHDPVTVVMNFEQLKQQLENYPFIQVHPHHIVHFNHISKLYDPRDECIELSDGERIPVGSSFLSSLNAIL